jgi:cephalosporin-C deacetylase
MLNYKIDPKPSDFDTFWKQALHEMRMVPFAFHVTEVKKEKDINEIGYFHYLGAKREKIYGFYLKHDDEKRPTMLMFHGYNYHKGDPHDYQDWYDLGVNVFAIDIRGQMGLTKDQYPYQSGDQHLMTRGLLQPEAYYMKHVYQDGIQLMNIVKTCPFVDENRIILHGASQGGGIVLALAALMDCYKVYADVPSYTYFRGRMDTKNGSIREIEDYCITYQLNRETVIHNMQYVDLVHLVDRIKAPVMASVGLKDDICPARYFMLAYDKITSPKSLYEYPDAGHEGGHMVHHRIKLNDLKETLFGH